VALLFGLAVWLVHRELQGLHYHDIRRSLEALSPSQILVALALTALSYLVLTGYDTLALRHLGRDVPYRRSALASFAGYAFSHNMGFALLGGAAPRYRLYSAWGLSALEIATIVAFVSVTFWLGGLTVSGVALLVDPLDVSKALRLSLRAARPLGVILLLPVILFTLASVLRKRPLTVRGWSVSIPSPTIAVSQVILSTVDWLLVAAALYFLLPSPRALSYWHFVGFYVLATMGSVISQVPGGLGVFEMIILVSLTRYTSAAAVLGSLLAFRATYYLLPLAVATILLAAHEAVEHRRRLKPLAALFGRWVPEVAPRMFAVTTFVGGTILLLSGATPTPHSRLAWLRGFLPLPVLEVSHFLGSLVGLGLVLLASGLQQRLDAAYHLTTLLLASGVVLSLLKGFHYHEALILAVMLLALIPCRRHFYRRASIISQRFGLGWTVAIVAVVSGFLWLGSFAHRHVEYANELWWQFSLSGDAPRFLRASVGVLIVGLFFAAAHLLRPTQPESTSPSAEGMDRVRRVVAASPSVVANLALVGDKSFLFSDDGNAFIMYGIAGRSWVAMGDPVGPSDAHLELVWKFRALCDRYAAWPVFYQTDAANLPIYLDVGLTPLKIGEEARVSLDSFSLEGRGNKARRHLVNRIEKNGGRFEILPPEAVPDILPRLKRISEAWLAGKRTREKGFSLGRFDPEYLRQFPVAIVRQGDAIVAFANIWQSAERNELSLDLMRYCSDAPASVMEYLFIELMLWGKREGYRWFSLGMAPLAGLESRALGPLWNKIGALAFRYGEHFYNFQGVRQYKEKFDPQWKPKYLVCPGGIVLPRILANIASLISGGLRGVVTR